MKICDNIRKLRVKLGLSQSEFARRVYVTPSYINRIEVGIRIPSAEVIERIAVAFKVSTDSRYVGISSNDGYGGIIMSYETIKNNYDRGLWNKIMVKMAVKKGIITVEQYKLITGEEYK